MRLGFCTLLAFCASTVSAQSFDAGWYIVEPCASFNVTRGAAGEDDLRDLQIVAGEAVLAAGQTPEGVLVYEAHGRISLVRPASCLTPAPAGQPAMLSEDVELLDRTIASGSVMWVTGLDAGDDVVTVVVNGGETFNLPTRKVSLLRAAYFAQPNSRPGWRSAAAR